MFEAWHDFFLLQGGAAATLVALLFVAASVGIGYLTTERLQDARVFMNPVVVHFTAVFTASAIALAPLHNLALFTVVLGGGALAGVVYSLLSTRRVMRLTGDITDRLAYGAIPGLAYIGVIAAMALLWIGADAGTDMLAGALLLLLTINIRNAWDLTIDLVRRNSERR
ncbi:MAG TPA: hypothetical protein VGC38_06850 [Pseudolabrys sp.]